MKTRKSSSIAATPDNEEEFNLKISNLRKTLSDSIAKMHEANKDALVAREYVKLVENRRFVAEKMIDEFDDHTYAKFEVKLWMDLLEYFNSGRSVSDKAVLAQALTGNIHILPVCLPYWVCISG